MIKKSFVDKVKEIPYKLGDIYTTKTNTFYIVTGVEYGAAYTWGSGKVIGYITITRISKNLKSQGNSKRFNNKEFEEKFKQLTEAQKLLFLAEEIKDDK